MEKIKNVFRNPIKGYKFEGSFYSDKSEDELDEILENLGFCNFKYDEISKPNFVESKNNLKKTNMGRPLKYSKEFMLAVVNRKKTDSELAAEIGKPENMVRNLRSNWTRNHPELIKV